MAFSASKDFKYSLLLGASAVAIVSGPATAQNANSSQETVVVTGTRVTGVSAADSAAPITVLGADSLSHSGTENLQQALSQTVPSFNVSTVGADLGNLTLTTNLRNLSPNDTLVLVNGKRRHGTANLNTGGGGAAPDLSLIPTAAIQHIEVLQDGAAAQYGTDAIAGVINIILKKNSSGGNISATTGQFYAGDGQSYDVSGNMGFPLFDKGFVNVTLDKAYHNFTQRGGAESHLIDAKGNVLPTPYDATKLPGYPRTNRIAGDAEYNLSTALVNAGYDINDDLHLYAFSTIGRKIGKAYENARRPDLIVASPTTGVAGKYGQPGAIVFAPNGFNPQEVLRENDYSYAVGANGKLAGWNWDLSTVYGKDHDDIYTENSGNSSLFIDTHTSPSNFYDGTFNATEWTTDLDISRQVNVGLASPLTVAGGFEARENTYAILAGDYASTYKEGGQSYPGFTSNDVGAHSRKNYGVYLDLAVAPIEEIQIDAAARFEHYTDFGDARIGKITMRWDITPQFAVRGTIDTGFRAPTLQEEFYTSTNVDPEFATVQLPADSPAAKVLGLNGLKPELSTSYSAGIVAHPLDDLSITLDGYSIAIGGRINGSPTLYGLGGAINSPAVLQAISVNGNVTDPTVTQVAVSALLNGYSTNTKGVDLVVNYPTDFEDYGLVNWTLAGNYNDTVVTHIPPTPVQLLPVALYTPQSIQNANHGQHIKVKFSANWTLDRWSANLVETFYGPYFSLNSPNAGVYYKEERGATGTTDLEVDYALTEDLKFGIGGRNILNKVPEFGPTTPTGGLVNTGDSIRNNPIGTGYGPDGGYYYARVAYTF